MSVDCYLSRAAVTSVAAPHVTGIIYTGTLKLGVVHGRENLLQRFESMRSRDGNCIFGISIKSLAVADAGLCSDTAGYELHGVSTINELYIDRWSFHGNLSSLDVGPGLCVVWGPSDPTA